MPKVSVIVAIYNIEKYVARALESVSAQTLRDLEIIAVDDGSTDRSGEIADACAKKGSEDPADPSRERRTLGGEKYGTAGIERRVHRLSRR